MRVSIVIPAYNEERQLPLCLDSLERLFAEGRYDVEVIVVNNASTDRTAEVAEGYPFVRVVHEPQKGMVRARQAGFLASSGELIANIDADTIVPAGWLDRVLEEFNRDGELAALSGPYVYYDLSLAHRIVTRIWYWFGYLSHLINHHLLKIGAMLQGGNFILRREHLEKIGGFDTSIEFYGEDTDVARRISQVGRVKWSFKLPMYTSGRRLKKEGTIRTALKYAGNYVYTLLKGRPLTKTYTDVRES